MKSWEYCPSESINKSIAEKLSIFPRERDMTQSILRYFWNIVLRFVLKIYFRLNFVGKENFPKGKSCVLISNHSSHLDAVCLSSVLSISKIDSVFSVAAKDYFFASFWRCFFSAVFVNALPFDREKRKKESLELCADVLNVSDRVLIMFPEGTRSKNGEIQRFKAGIGILVAGTDRLVVPSYIEGAHRAWPKGVRVPRPKKVTVRIGAPMNFSHLSRDKKGYAEVAKLTESAVQALANK